MTTPTPGQPLSEADVKPFRSCVGEAILGRQERLHKRNDLTPAEMSERNLIDLIIESVGEVGDYDGPPHGDAHPLDMSRPHAPVQPAAGRDTSDAIVLLVRAKEALQGHIDAIQQAKREGGSSAPITDCINALPEIVRWLDAGQFEIEAAFEEYEEAALTPPAEPVYRPAGEGEAVSLIAELEALENGTVSECPWLAVELAERAAKALRLSLLRPAAIESLVAENERMREALNRLVKLTPGAANAATARDLHLTVAAIASTALEGASDDR